MSITLPQSIEQEGGNFIQLVTNRYKIVALTCVDTFNGEQKQISLRPQMKKKMTNIVRQARSWMGPLKPKRNQRIHNEKYDLPGIINDRPFIQLLVGKKDSGKSVLCCKLLLTPYRFCFDRIVFISPTFQSTTLNTLE